jgi:hypothetical protein
MEKLFDWNAMVPKIYSIDTNELNLALKEWRREERKSWKSVINFIKDFNIK